MSQDNEVSNADLVARLEALKVRLNLLNTRRTRLETKIEASRKEYARLAQDAQEKYGTTNIAQLQARLAAIQAENLAAVTTFEKDLNQYEAALDLISEKVG